MEIPEKFDDLKISHEVKKALKDYGLSGLFPIQAEAVPILLKGEDLVGQAQTGTGKTAAFAIPIIERIDPKQKEVQAIILVPTRELAVQVNDEIRKFGKYKKVSTLTVYGGVSIDRQIDVLNEGVQIVVGTPGRVIDHIKRGTLKLNKIRMLVLDEADRMLDMGFIEDIKFILDETPKTRQTMLFSATMPETITFLAKDYMKEYKMISVSKDELTVKDTEQTYVEVTYYNKIDTIKKILSEEKIESAIIFCNTKRSVDTLHDILRRNRFRVESIHGNFSQAKRNKSIAGFRSGAFKILIATDVAARGLDIKGVSHVINYNLPHDPKDYVHRIGRTGRAGKPGKAISLVSEQDKEFLSSIEWYIEDQLKKVDYGVPKGRSGPGPGHSHRPQQGRREYQPRDSQDSSKKKNMQKYALGEF